MKNILKMKNVPALSRTLLFALLVSVAFAGCSKDNDESGGEVGASDSYVKIELEDGNIIELKNPTQIMGGISPIGSFSTSLTDYEVIVIIQLYSFGEPTVGQQFTPASITARNVADEDYRSFYYKNKETGEEGEGEVTITAIGDKHVKGTFSAIMYSKSGKRATIEGRFFQEL